MRAPGVLITVAAWVTLVFAALEFLATRYPEKCPPVAGLTAAWSPSSLPPLEKSGNRPQNSAAMHKPWQKSSSAFSCSSGCCSFRVIPFLLMGPGAVVLDVGPFRLADAWWTFYWWIVALNALQLAWRCIDLLRDAWQYPSEIQHFVVKIFGLVPIVLMLQCATTRIFC